LLNKYVLSIVSHPVGKLHKVGNRELLGTHSEEAVLVATEVTKGGL
jgi:hypothetical protein